MMSVVFLEGVKKAEGIVLMSDAFGFMSDLERMWLIIFCQP